MLVPIFGNMGLNTLYQWHKSGLHPFNLYAPQAQTNQPLIIDGYLSGPWPALLHDIFHAQGMNLLSTKGRQRIFDQFISVVSLLQERIISRAADFDTETEIKSRENYLTDIIERLYDFNLSVPSAYSEQKERIISWSEFKNYLKNCIERLYNFIFSRPKNYSEQKVTLNRYLRFAFTKVFPNDSLDSNMLYSSNENAIKPIGFPIADHMYFLLHQFLHEPQYAGYKDTISFILNSVDNTGQFRDPKVLLALRTVAKNAVKNPNKLIADPNALKSCQVDWFEWVKLIYSTDDSLPLWIKINNDSARRQELLRMMSKGFTFFSFHLKMTEEKKGEFKTFLFTLLKDEQIFGLFERAITDKNLDRFKDLIKYKANINVESDCLTPLYIVAERGYKDMVTLLLDHPSCNVDIRNAWGGTALSVASINGYPGIVKLLLDKGADPYATFTKSFASSERATLLDKVIGNIGIKSKKDENQYIEKQYEIAKILIEAMVLKKLNKPKPSVLEKNEELSGYWDELNKKGVETNKEMQHSDKHGFFQNKGRVKVSEIPRNGPREEGRPSLSSSRCVLQ